jgi:hypothetical protein
MTQIGLFTPGESARLSRQQQKILTRLEPGKVSNSELMGICIRYSARIHELRKKGYRVRIVSRDRDRGVTWYELVR